MRAAHDVWLGRPQKRRPKASAAGPRGAPPRAESWDSLWVLALIPEGSTAPSLEGTDRREALTLLPVKPQDVLLKAKLCHTRWHRERWGQSGSRVSTLSLLSWSGRPVGSATPCHP